MKPVTNTNPQSVTVRIPETEKYLGAGLCDKNGVPIREGDTVKMLGDEQRIRRVKWHSLDGPITRLEIGSGWWLTPYTAEMCEVIEMREAPDARRK
jgi:hypothetical protein